MNSIQIQPLNNADLLVSDLKEQETTAVLGGFSLGLNFSRKKTNQYNTVTSVTVGDNYGGVNQVAGRDINGNLNA